MNLIKTPYAKRTPLPIIINDMKIIRTKYLWENTLKSNLQSMKII